MLGRMVPLAELRVFQPLEAFPPDEQRSWERYIVAGAPKRTRPVYADHPTPAGLGFLYERDDDGAHVKVVEDAYYVCPLRTKMRVLAGMLAVAEAGPFEDPAEFLSERDRRRARRELRRLRRRNPGHVATIMQSPWHVPIRWLVLVEDEERRLHEEDEGRLRLSYITTTRKAMGRVERAVPVLRHTELGPIADLLVELHQWLATFDPGSLLELDYGRICASMSWDEVDDDHSARDIHDALRALAQQDYVRSADLYQAALSRSTQLRSHESTN
jgi:hypothetical protein